MSEHLGVVIWSDSARFARSLCAKSGAHKENRTSIVRTRTQSAFVRALRAVCAHKTVLVRLRKVRHAG